MIGGRKVKFDFGGAASFSIFGRAEPIMPRLVGVPDRCGIHGPIFASLRSASIEVSPLPRGVRGHFNFKVEGDIMADPRNVAHDKKVRDEKKHHGEEVAPGATETPQPGKKPTLEKEKGETESYQQHAQHHKGDDAAE